MEVIGPQRRPRKGASKKKPPTRENRHRFRSWTERINSVQVDVLRRTARDHSRGNQSLLDESLGESSSSHFEQQFNKWRELNLTGDFTAFIRDIGTKTDSLALLLHNKAAIIQLIVKHLGVPNSKAVKPLCSCLSALARDLGQEVYPSFQTDILPALLKLLDTKDADQLEDVFSCLAYLFKFLLRMIVADFAQVFDALIVLLAHKMWYIRRFSAEVLSFLVRKMPGDKLEGAIALILDRAAATDASADLHNGAASLLFETVKGVQQGFHSRLGEVIGQLLHVVEEAEGTERGIRFVIAQRVVVRICEHCRAEQSDAMWQALFDVLDAALAQGNATVRTCRRVRDALHLMAVCAAHRGGTRLRDAAPMLERIGKLLSKDVLGHKDASAQTVAACMSLALVVMRVADTQQLTRYESAWKSLFNLSARRLVISVSASLCEHVAFARLYQQHVLATCESAVKAGDTITALALLDCIPPHTQCKVPKLLNQEAVSLISKQQHTEETWLALRCLERAAREGSAPQSLASDLDAMLDKLVPIACKEAQEVIVEDKDKDMSAVVRAERMAALQLPRTAHVMLQALATRLALARQSTAPGQGAAGGGKSSAVKAKADSKQAKQKTAGGCVSLVTRVRAVLQGLTHSAVALNVVMAFFSEGGDAVREGYALDELVAMVAVNLSSADQELRMATLRILHALAPESNSESEESNAMSDRQVLELLLSIEEAPADAINGKQRNLKLLQLQTSIEYGKIPACVRPLLMPFLVGQIRNKFTLPWQAAVDCMTMLASVYPKLVWQPFVAYLEAYTRADYPHKSVGAQDIDEEEEEERDKVKDREARMAKIGKARAKEERVPEAQDVSVRELSATQFAARRFASVAMSHSFGGSTCVDATVQLLKAAAKQPMHVQNHSQPFVKLFLSFLTHQYDPLFEEDASAADANNDATPHASSLYAKLARTEATRILLGYLELFSKMSSVNPLYKAEELKQTFTRLLTKTHGGIQLHALRCLCVWGDEGVIPYKKNLENVIDDTKYRHELSLFQVDMDCSVVDPSHRAQLLPVLTRLLYAKIVQRKVVGAKAALSQRRSHVLAWFAGMRDEELDELMHIILAPFQNKEGQGLSLAGVSHKKLLGFMNTLGDLVGQLGHLLERHLDVLLGILLDIVRLVFADKDEEELQEDKLVEVDEEMEEMEDDKDGENEDEDGEDDEVGEDNEQGKRKKVVGVKAAKTGEEENNEEENEEDQEEEEGEGEEEKAAALDNKQVSKRLRSLALKRVTNILRKYQTHDFSSFMPALLQSLSDKIKLLPVQNTQSSVGLMQTFQVLAEAPHLSSYLFSSDCVLPAVFACLSAPRAAMSVRQTSLTITQVLLAGEHSELMHPHVRMILSHIHSHMLATQRSGGVLASKDPKIQWQVIGLLRQQFSVLSIISAFPCETGQAVQLCDLLLPFLAPGRKLGGVASSEQARMFVLNTLANLVGRVQEPERYAEVAGRQLLLPSSEALRVAACKFVCAIGDSVHNVAGLVSEMNTWNKARMGEYDFERRLTAYNACTSESFLSKLHERELAILACQCVHDVRDKDFSVRTHAAKLASTMFNILKDVEGGAAAGAKQDRQGARWKVYADLMMPTLRKYLRDKDRTVRTEAFKLLMVSAQLFQVFHADLQGLMHEDPERDISKNIVHMQLHRRVRALVRLQACIKTGNFASATLRHFLQPVVWSFIIDPQEKDRMKQTDGAYNISDEGIRTAGVLAGHMSWGDYKALLWTAVREMSKEGVNEKPLVKVISAVMQAFHFEMVPPLHLQEQQQLAPASASASLPVREEKHDDVEGVALHDPGADEDAALQNAEVDTKDGEMDVDKGVDGAASTADNGMLVYNEVVNKVLPALKKMLTEKPQLRAVLGKTVQEGKLRAPIALAMVHVLKLLPKQVLTVQLPHVIGVVCNGLRSREQSERDAVRRSLSDIMKSLGPYYLHFVLYEIRGALQKGGYQQHVMGYSISAVLDSVKDQLAGDTLLPCLPLLLRLYEEELLGEVANEKEVDKLAVKNRETRTTVAYSVFEIIGRTLAFEHVPTHVLEPDHDFALRKVVLEAATLKARRRLREVLRRLGLGIAANISLDSKGLLVWTHTQLMRYVPSCVQPEKKQPGKANNKPIAATAEGTPEQDGSAPSEPRSQLLVPRAQHAMLLKPVGPDWERRARAGEAVSMLEGAESVSRNEYLFAEFALSLLHTSLKRNVVDIKDMTMRQMLDPFVVLLKQLLLSKHDDIVVLALRCLAQLLKADIPSLATELPWVLKAVFYLLQRAGSTGSLTAQGCFKAITAVLREETYAKLLTQAQLKVLLSFAKQDITEVHSQAVAFGLIKSIIDRRLVCVEVYDIMETISQHLVTAQSEQMRNLCAQTLIQFLLNYPLGEKRLDRHVSFLVENLEYEYEEGRKVVLELLDKLVVRLPGEVYEKYVEFLFLPLITRLVNDESATCRKMVGLLIGALVKRANRTKTDALIDVVLTLLGGGDILRRRAGAQVLGIMIETLGDACERYSDKLATTLSSTVKTLVKKGGDNWELVYYVLVAAEKMLRAVPKLASRGDIKHLAPFMDDKVLLHKHAWVRLSASRIMGTLFGGGGDRLGELLEKVGGGFAVLKGLCAQIAAQTLDERLGEQVIKNLCFLSLSVISDASLCPEDKIDADDCGWNDSDSEEEGEAVQQHAAQQQDDQVDMQEEKDEDEADEDEEEEEAGPKLANGGSKGVKGKGGKGKANGVVKAAGKASKIDNGQEDEGGNEVEVKGKKGSKKRVSEGGDQVSDAKKAKVGVEGKAASVGVVPRAVRWVFARMSHIARKHGGDRRSCVFKYFAAMSVKLDSASVIALLKIIVTPLFRAIETESTLTPEETCKELAQELVEMLQNLLGMEAFHAAYNAVREARNARKEARRGEKALARLLDPKMESQRRIRKNLKKKELAKRKIEGFREMRGDGKKQRMSVDDDF